MLEENGPLPHPAQGCVWFWTRFWPLSDPCVLSEVKAGAVVRSEAGLGKAWTLVKHDLRRLAI